MQKVKYSELRGKLNNLDQVEFSGSGLTSRAVRMGQSLGALLSGRGLVWVRNSHVASIIKYSPEEIAAWMEANQEAAWLARQSWLSHRRIEETGAVVLFESTTTRTKKGVQVNLFSDVLAAYKGRCWVRPMLLAGGYSVLADQNFVHATLGLPYEKEPLEFVGAGIEWVNVPQGHASYFCSELSAERQQNVDLMQLNPEGSKYGPEDLRVGGKFEKALVNCRLGDEIEVVL